MATTAEQGIGIGTKVIHKDVQDSYDLQIESHNNELECRATITVHDLENSIAPAALIALLKGLKITDSIDLEKVAIFCTEAAQGNDPQSFLLARGVAETTGKDGWFQLEVNTSGDGNTSFEEDEETGKVDFKAVQTFTNIEPGQIIGKIYPPELGTAGKTITGLPIPAEEGKPANLILGDGINQTPDSSNLVAEKPGRVILDENRIFITEEFVVKGDVDLSVGNINFNGFVEISGDVLDDFDIKASKGISINGAVGACQIESDGPVTIGSINGMGIGLIRCKGDFQARYLNHATVECWGDIKVASEIRNSIVKATGSIVVEKGNITGGQTVAMEGIEAKIIGTRTGVKTHLISGIHFPETDRLQFLRTRIQSATYQTKRINETLGSLKKKPLDTMRNALREATEMRIDILSKRQETLKEEREAFTEELANFETSDHPTANAKINILDSLKEGAIISLGETTEEIKLELSGPISAIENSNQEGLRVLTHSPLKVSAAKLEAEELMLDSEE